MFRKGMSTVEKED